MIRSRVTNWSGLSPVVCLKTREKWNGLSSTRLANESTEISSESRSLMWSSTLVELADGQAAVDLGFFAGGAGVFLEAQPIEASLAKPDLNPPTSVSISASVIGVENTHAPELMMLQPSL